MIAATMAITLATNSGVNAEQLTIEQDVHTFAYAPTNDGMGEYNFDMEYGEEYEEHEMNDAWLGMPAFSNSGEMIGVIIDAFLNDQGDVNEVMVELNSSMSSKTIYIEARLVSLNETQVSIDLDTTTIANLENEETILASQH